MTGRRQFGTIRKLPSGRWQASYNHLGRRQSAPSTFKAKGDAAAWLSTVETDIRRGAWVDGAAGRITVVDFATGLLGRRSDLRPTTRAKGEALLRLHVVPTLGATPIDRLTPSAVRSWYLALARCHQTTADDAYRMLRAIMNTAVTDGALVRSPCQVRGAGQVRSVERPVASVAEVAAAVEAVPEELRLAVLLPAWCQLRRGEVLGLQRGDIDLLHGTVRVRRAWVVPMTGIPVLGEPKTAAGSRTLAVPGHVRGALADHLDRFVAARPDAWLFPGVDGLPLRPQVLNRAWARARKHVGRPDLHLHDLRHSGLTWAAATGASVAELMRRGGHASPSAALRYQHATEDRDRALADALSGLALPVNLLDRGLVELGD